jgi:excisionase family DNA binding protein
MTEEHQDTNDLLSAEEAATRLIISKKTLLKWAREGTIGSVRLSAKMIRFSEEQLTEFIRRMTHEIRPEKTRRSPAVSPRQVAQPPFKPAGKQESKMSPKEIRKRLREEMQSLGKDED